MQIIYGIGIFMITSSFIMISFVWVMNFRVNQSEYPEISEENNYFSEQAQSEQSQDSPRTLAA